MPEMGWTASAAMAIYSASRHQAAMIRPYVKCWLAGRFNDWPRVATPFYDLGPTVFFAAVRPPQL
jgi:hypothetical protein